jgi:hypothetical protein
MQRSLAQKLRLFIEKLSSQEGVFVKEKIFNPGASEKQLKNIWPYLPDDMREFYKEMNGLTFVWHFASNMKNGVRRGKTGADFDGRIRLSQFDAKSIFRKNDSGYNFPKDLNFLILDFHVPEASAYLVFPESKSKLPYVAFAKAAEEDKPQKFGSFTEYIERSIENAFGWYWPFKSGRTPVALLEREGPFSLPLEYEVELSDFSTISGDQHREQALKWKGTVAKKIAKALGLATSQAVGPLHKDILKATKDIDALDNDTIRALLKAILRSGGSIEKSKQVLKEYFESPPPASLVSFSVSLESLEMHPGERVLKARDIARLLSFCPQSKGFDVFFPELAAYDYEKAKRFPLTTEPGFPRVKNGKCSFQVTLPQGHIPEKKVSYKVSFV